MRVRAGCEVAGVTPTAFVSHHFCSLHDTGWGHPDHQGRLPAVVRAVHRDMLALHDRLLQVEAAPATEDDLLRVHTPEHVARVREASARAAREGRPLPLEGEVVVSGASWDAALAAAGAAVTGAELVLRGEAANAFCLTRPPGRGAAAGRAGGHSLFNTVMVAAASLRKRHGVERVLVVDWGAAAPRGALEIAAGTPGVWVAAAHAADAGPDRSPRISSVGVPSGSGADGLRGAVTRALERVVEDLARGEPPGLVFLSLGLDVLSADPLGALRVEPEDVHGLTGVVLAAARDLCGGRLVSVLEGGYDASATGRAVVQHLRALAGLPPA